MLGGSTTPYVIIVVIGGVLAWWGLTQLGILGKPPESNGE
jgi:hypothetical protein